MKRKLIIGALIVATLTPFSGRMPIYAADTNNEKLTGWVYEDNYWYYYNNNGEKVKNTTITEGDKNFTLNEDGVWVLSEEDKKAMEESAAKAEAEYEAYLAKYPNTNECSEDYKNKDDRWIKENGDWYFNWKDKSTNITIKNTWQQINGFWYHFDKDGKMDKNTTIKDECNNDCVLNEDGALTNRTEPEFAEDDYEQPHEQYKKHVVDGNEYYLNDKGEKKIGWVYDDEDKKWHFTNFKGVAQKNKTLFDINGKKYKLDNNGAWIR